MNKIKNTVLFLWVLLSFSACEKDDICVDGNTPLLVIGFYDFNDKETVKAVPKIRVKGEGKEALTTFADRTDLETISIPLNPTATDAKFSFIINSADNDAQEETGNPDTVTFSYAVKEKFISRACGFVATYDNLSSAVETDTENWIKEIQVDVTLVEDQTMTHVKIFH